MSSKLPVVGIVETPPKRDEPEPAAAAPPTNDGPFEEEKVWEQLRTVFDPEIPVNVVELGLIYRCEALPLPEGGYRVEIDMSMTAPGCGMADVIQEDVRGKVRSAPGVREVSVRIVWDPPWDPSRMSDAARLQLGWM
ncbi:MAG TPA: iron-sulfur cluster assembly protein [Myxococcales bacterium]|nr:iron-sulfur cluster assembly protein [Myxococcales bacterium]